MRIFVLFCLGIMLFCGCSNSYRGKDIFGSEEFVRDSYKIREGKVSILEMEGKETAFLPTEYLEEYKDTIRDDDILTVVVYHPLREDLMLRINNIGKELGYRVAGGKISLPDLSQVEVAGLTLEEAKEKIEKQYSREIGEIEVFLSYRQRLVKKVELAGLTALSSVPVDGRLRLFDLLSMAKVPTNANLFKSYVVRDGKLLPVDFRKLLKEGDMSQNIVMRGEDKVYIADPTSANIMVMGEVNEEKVLNLPDGSMSLREALAAARGIAFTGDKSYIQVIRGNIVNPKIYILDWEHVIHLPNDSLLLMPGDIVYVASKPITEWNRFISQLLPSFTGYDMFRKMLPATGVWAP